LANQPVAFPLLTATDRSGERAGEIVAAGGLAALPPIRTVLRFGRKLVETALPIHLEVRLTEIGTLEVWCRARTTDHRWRLEFRLREPAGEAAPAAEAAGLVIEPARVEEAARLLAAAFAGGDDPVTLTRRLEAALGAGRDAWPLAALRALGDTLWPLQPGRARRSCARCGRRSGAASGSPPRRAPSWAGCSSPRRSAGARPSRSCGRWRGSARAPRSTARSTAWSGATRRRRGRSGSSAPSG